MTATTFKERYANHKKSFKFHRYKNDTELSKYIWELKSNDRDYTLKWSILKRAGAYTHPVQSVAISIHITLNKRSEIFAKCRHREKFWADRNFDLNDGNYDDARQQTIDYDIITN